MQKTISITQDIPRERVENLLCDALEGGSNYWYMIKDKIEPVGEGFAYYGSHNEKKTKYLHLYPLQEGGALMIDDSNADEPELKEPVRLDWARVKEGLRLWALDAMKDDEDKTRGAHPRLWADFIKDNTDAETADCFLQYCIFGKVIYG